MKIYFAGSIRGGRKDQQVYRDIIKFLRTHGTVLTEHISDQSLSSEGESSHSDAWIYSRDIDWLSSADIVIAEVSTPSLGVGYEISRAENLLKPVICLYRTASSYKLSAMIAGNSYLDIFKYASLNEALEYLSSFFKQYKGKHT